VPDGYFFTGDPGFDTQGNLYVTETTLDTLRSGMVVKLSPNLQPLSEWK
jgi:hypothetical protein